MIVRIIRTQQNLGLSIADVRLTNNPAKKNERGHGVGERIVPAKSRMDGSQFILELELENQVAEGE